MGKTSKPLDIIVDETLFDLPEIQVLVEEGHTIKKLMGYGYDLIIGPKASNLAVSDVTGNPKLLAIAIDHAKKIKYNKPVSKSEAKRLAVQGVSDGVQNTTALDGATAQGNAPKDEPSKPAPRKRKPRAKKQAAPVNEPAGPVDTGANNPADSTSGGK